MSPPVPEWCGQCAEHTRRLDVRFPSGDYQMIDCPNCHPDAAPANIDIEPEPGEASDEQSDWDRRTRPGGSFVLDAPDTPPAMWGYGSTILWAQGEALMMCGPAGVGKTTLANQLVRARLGIGEPEVLGMPVRPGERRVLYLAMDRPPQISRAMRRVFSESDRQLLDERLVVWQGPPPQDLARRPELLAAMCAQADADTVVVDSLKDAVMKLSDDEAGSGYHRARSRALVDGVEVLELHHQRKAGGDNKKPAKIDDVYGSTWLTAGAGSVLLLWGQAGDPIVELLHLKQPAEPFGPHMVIHDHTAGTTQLHHAVDLLQSVKNQGRLGISAQVAACQLFTTDKPDRNELEKARRRLEALVRSGHLVRVDGTRGGRHDDVTRWFLAGEE